MDDIVVNSSAVSAIATALLRQLLAWAGTALVAKGLLTPETADSILGPATDLVFGVVLMGGAAAWAAWKAKRTTTKQVDLVAAVHASPDETPNVVLK